MQKKIIALAVAGLASTAAFAQTNVTIYGVADATFDYVSATGTVNNNFDNQGRPLANTHLLNSGDFKARNRISSNSSYIGFKGVEDLGNGLKAVFQVENGLNFDNGGGTAGATGGSWANRDSYVGLSGGFGTLVLGNLTGPTRALGAKMDVNAGATGIGSNNALIGKLAGQGGGASYFDQRLNNAVAYISPTMAGFSAVVGYTAGSTFASNNTLGGAFQTAAPAENAAASNTVRGNQGYTLGLNFAGGPVEVGYAYTRVEFTANRPANLLNLAGDNFIDNVSNHRAGVIGKIGTVAQVNFMADFTQANVSGLGKTDQVVYYVGGKVFVGKGAIIGQYGLANDIRGTLSQNGDETHTGAQHFVLGYEHNLSKRTILKAVYSQVMNQEQANYDFLYGVGNGNTTANQTANYINGGADPRGLSVGIRHSF